MPNSLTHQAFQPRGLVHRTCGLSCGKLLVALVPAQKSHKQYHSHHRKTCVYLPAMQQHGGENRSARRQHHQKGSFALGQFFLLCHSLFASRLRAAHQAPRRRFRSLIPCQFPGQVNDLPHMMIRMPCAAQQNLEPVSCFRFPLRRVRFSPISSALFPNRRRHHFYRPIKSLQSFFFARPALLRELLVAVSHVPRLRYPRSNVVIQIACQVQHQMPHAISIRIRFPPELLAGKRIHPLVQILSHEFVIIRQPASHNFIQLSQSRFAFPGIELRATP